MTGSRSGSFQPPLSLEQVEEDPFDWSFGVDRDEATVPHPALPPNVLLESFTMIVVDPVEFSDGGDIDGAAVFAVDEPQVPGQFGINLSYGRPAGWWFRRTPPK